jgi:hypothetical protein
MGRAGLVASLGGAALVLAANLPARANDSSAELSVGGLVFTRSPDVSMESEELRISPERVVVRYRFVNQSPKPVTLTVAFPLPDIDLSDSENVTFPANDPVNFVGFETSIDGKPVTFTVNQQAFLGPKNVTDVLRGLAVPLLPIGPQQLRLGELPEPTRQKLVERGLLVQAGTSEKGEPLYEGSWTVKTSMVRQQTFAPGRPTIVEHQYRTSIGQRRDTVLRKGLRDSGAMEKELERYRAQYCIKDDFLAGLDKIAGTAEANTAKVKEYRISYVLKTGANWAGPIKDFKLVVDKGRPDRLISFCGDNVVKISPTSFQVTAKDFKPEKDLAILIVGRSP